MQHGSDTTSTQTSEIEVQVQTITNTIASSGELESALDEKLELHATYYLEEVYIEENETINEGENILKYTNGKYLTAPYNCVIKSLSIPDIEEKCTNSNYIEVCALDLLSMEISVDEDEISKVSVGQEVEISLNTDSSKKYIGNIINISNSGKYSSRGTTFTATVEFNNDSNIKIGMSANCSIIVEKAENVVTVPTEAITTKDSKKTVTVIKEDGTTKSVEIETGISNDAYTEVKSGLNENEKVQITKKTSNNTREMSGFPGGEMPSMNKTQGSSNERERPYENNQQPPTQK